MTKVFVLGAPGSGILKAAEELYIRDDFKKTFKKDPVYKRAEFPKDARWADLKECIDNNYRADQEGVYEIHAGWWLYKYFQKIKENYPNSYIVLTSRHDRDSLQNIGVTGSPASTVEARGGEESWKNVIKEVDEYVHSIVENENFKWVYIESGEKSFNDDLTIVERQSEIKKATVKLSIGKL